MLPFLARKIFTFYIKICYYLNVQFQGQRVKSTLCPTIIDTKQLTPTGFTGLLGFLVTELKCTDSQRTALSTATVMKPLNLAAFYDVHKINVGHSMMEL